MTEIKRDPYPDLPTTGCERCDANRHKRQNEQALHDLEAAGRIVAAGERPCLECGKPQTVYVARTVH
jgi:hypothetical protein